MPNTSPGISVSMHIVSPFWGVRLDCDRASADQVHARFLLTLPGEKLAGAKAEVLCATHDELHVLWFEVRQERMLS